MSNDQDVNLFAVLPDDFVVALLTYADDRVMPSVDFVREGRAMAHYLTPDRVERIGDPDRFVRAWLHRAANPLTEAPYHGE